MADKSQFCKLLQLFTFFLFLTGVLVLAKPQNSCADTSAGCATDTWVAMANQAALETRREDLFNKRYIVKADSVLQYSCFADEIENMAANIGPIFSNGTQFEDKVINLMAGVSIINPYKNGFTTDSLGEALEKTVTESMQPYIDGQFGHIVLSGTTELKQEAELCLNMKEVWQAAKCKNFDGTNIFMRFDELVDYDPREFPPNMPCDIPAAVDAAGVKADALAQEQAQAQANEEARAQADAEAAAIAEQLAEEKELSEAATEALEAEREAARQQAIIDAQAALDAREAERLAAAEAARLAALANGGGTAVPGSCGTIDGLISDMSRPVDALLKGYENSSFGFTKHATISQGLPNTASLPAWMGNGSNFENAAVNGYYNQVLPWFVVFEGAANQNSNVDISLKDLQVSVLLKSGAWITSPPNSPTGHNCDLGSALLNCSGSSIWSDNPDGSRSYQVEANQNMHGWGSFVEIPASEVIALSVSIQAKVEADGGGCSNNSQYLLHTGADYYPYVGYKNVGVNPGAGVSAAKIISCDYTTFTMTTLTDIAQNDSRNPNSGITSAQLRSNPPPCVVGQ